MDYRYHTIKQLGQALRADEITPSALTEQCLQRIRAEDPHLGAFQCLTVDRARAEARVAETEIENGIDRGRLHGIPYAVKDLYDVAGLPTTAGTDLLRSNIANHDAAVIQQLHQAGAILIGKTKTVQFAYGGAGINTQQGTPHNPWHQQPHLPGGSSSGSAVAVAAGLVPMALGTDTGGSIRIPAAHCGITGLKTTVGQISRAGIYALSWSMDSVGLLTRTAEDAALVYPILAATDPNDKGSVACKNAEVQSSLDRGIANLRLAIPETVFFDDADPEVVSLVRDSAHVFTALDADVDTITFPIAAEALALNPRGLIIAAEAYTLNRTLIEQHFDELDPVVATRMAAGGHILAHEYLQIIRAWTALRKRAVAELSDIDALLCPTVMIPPIPTAEVNNDLKKYTQRNLQCVRNTAIGNVLNLCAVSVPCGFTAAGLPVGLMLYSKPGDEATALRIGHAFQGATDWHRQTPSPHWL